ncbi:uncharacterized protein [Amphiura filiformis]|uniref:uncharacterized protein n=1 Tax=Amphiura filiformis TaxID=82378 RepID=UPI003B20EE38
MELVKFILTTTYFTSKGIIYQQKKGAAMGSPLSPIAVDLFMEWLEVQAIATAPAGYPTGSIKFTYEEEIDGSIPFLDTQITRKPDGTTKLSIYRKPTHTNQYLQFQSHHPLHQKLGVVRTLLDRKDAIVTEEADKEEEEKKINEALTQCGYPSWAIDKVKEQTQKPKTSKNRETKDTKDKTKGSVVVPYVEGLSERMSRVFKKHGFSTAMKPHSTLRNMLVHPKDKRDPSKQLNQFMKYLARAVRRPTLERQAVFSKLDYLNTKLKPKK